MNYFASASQLGQKINTLPLYIAVFCLIPTYRILNVSFTIYLNLND